MSGYFDALMRSTGVESGRSMPATAHLDSGVVEVDVETRTEGVAPSASPQIQVAREIEPEAAIEQTDPDPVTRPAAAVTSAALPANPIETRTAAPPGQEAPADLGQAMIRAAMRWVAADAVLHEAVQPRVETRVHGHDTILHREDSPVVEPPRVIRAHDVDLPSQVLNDTVPSERPTPAELAPRQAVTTTPAVLPRSAPTAAAVPMAHDEAFEISIGAIHVRVDAPPAQTLARPQPTPPAVASRAGSASPRRSALSRRALRRI